MKQRKQLWTFTTINYFVALVWLTNGLMCKVLNLVPRHQQIVARILGDEHAIIITEAIGISEVLMAIWVFSEIRRRLCTLVQVILIAVMNILEFILAPDLLLFGRFNIVVSAFFILFLLANEFILQRHKSATNFSS